MFFFLEKLKITPRERKAIASLMIIFVLLAVCNLALKPSEPFKDEEYAEMQQQFRERTAQLKAKRAKRMKRYFPPKLEQPKSTAIADTITPDTTDSTSNAKENREADESMKSRINVNKADRKTLKTLPGIGPAYSKRIIEYRQEHGGFKTIGELKKIKGIGEKRLEKLMPFIKLTDPQ